MRSQSGGGDSDDDDDDFVTPTQEGKSALDALLDADAAAGAAESKRAPLDEDGDTDMAAAPVERKEAKAAAAPRGRRRSVIAGATVKCTIVEAKSCAFFLRACVVRQPAFVA